METLKKRIYIIIVLVIVLLVLLYIKDITYEGQLRYILKL